MVLNFEKSPSLIHCLVLKNLISTIYCVFVKTIKSNLLYLAYSQATKFLNKIKLQNTWF